jgi:peptidoglycan/xylan/chitin deacetylase (PgdA/CDA1 family)
MASSHYYHSLKPFRKWFETGFPILTYHKLGSRPRGARLKGLYVNEELFDRQLAELSEAGFTSAFLDRISSTEPAKAQRNIALTFDDGFCNVFRVGLPLLARYKFRAIEFLVADLIGKSNEWEQREGEVAEPLMDAAQVREWLAAGHEIGSHTLTHPHLAQIPVAAARAEISDSKKKLEDKFGCPIHHFCYPFGNWNEAVRDLVMEAGYLTACTTQIGVNPPGTMPYLLKRFTARYPSRSFTAIWSRMRMRWAS